MDGVDSYKARRKCSNKEGQGQSGRCGLVNKGGSFVGGVSECRCLRLCAVTHRCVLYQQRHKGHVSMDTVTVIYSVMGQGS